MRLRIAAKATAAMAVGATGADVDSPPVDPAGARTDGRPARAWLGRHALFGCALVLGIAIRAVVIDAYRPALLYTDTFAYLSSARSLSLLPERPVGYSFFLRPFVLGFHDLTTAFAAVQIVQHVIGLALAIAVYAFLRRRGLPGWGATLGALPLLLDPLELALEHYILSDLLFAAFVVSAVLAIFWDHRPGWAAVTAAGLLIGFATIVRGAGTFLAVVFVVALLFLRVPWRRLVGFLVAFAIPVAAYSFAYLYQHGQFTTSGAGADFLYARIAPFIDCDDPSVHLTSQQRQLCPTQPIGQRPNTNQFRWDLTSPLVTVPTPPGETHEQFVGRFNKLLIRAQPVPFATAVLKDVGRGFAPTRTEQVPGYPSEYWLFQPDYWIGPIDQSAGITDPVLHQVSVGPTAARFLARYRTYVYLPGPLAALLLLLGLIAALGFGRSRLCGNRVLIGTASGACLLVLGTDAALSSFSWRYQLPQIALVPMVGALAIAALVRGRAEGAPDPLPQLRPLDRGAALLARLPLPEGARTAWERATGSGLAQGVVAAGLGLAAAVLVMVGAIGSGYLRIGTAAVIGLVAGVVVAALLVVGRARAVRARAARPPA